MYNNDLGKKSYRLTSVSIFKNCFSIDEHYSLQLIFKRKNQEGVKWKQPQLIGCHGAGECCLLQRQMEIRLHQE